MWLALLFALTAAAQSWQPQQSGTTVSLRGVSALSPQIAWASGAKGTFLRTLDGGQTWVARTMPGAADLDFRDVEAVDEKTVYLLAAGEGPLSRVYKTSNGGEAWQLLATNLHSKGFWDCMSFWDATHGIIVGDSVDGRMTVLTTSDGVRWQERQGPKANPGEGAFAASGSCVFTRGTREAWFVTGAARVFHTVDGGESWTVAKTPMRSDSANAGIFSIAFSDALHGWIVGGDYTKPDDAAQNAARTEDGGKTWLPATGLRGFRSAVAYVPSLKSWLATGTSGSDWNSGSSWQSVEGGYNALSFAPGASVGWAVGAEGKVARFDPPR